MKIIMQPKFGKELELLPFKVDDKTREVIYYEGGVQAGFPSPADDFKEQRISLDRKYLEDPESTFLIKVKGESMYPTLQVDDILIIKSNINLDDNNIAIVSVNHTDYTVKRFSKCKNQLVADNKEFGTISICKEDTIICLGIVKHLIRDV